MNKIIGICTTKINEEFSRNYLDRLHTAAKDHGYSLAVFHSIHDFYEKGEEMGAKEIFRLIPFEALSALIILRNSIYDSELLEHIISGARAEGVPVILARGTDSRCYSLIGDFEDAYEELLTGIVGGQQISDTFYVAGREVDDIDSVQRLSIYKKVMQKCGYKYDQNRVTFGGYWEAPAAETAMKLLEDREHLPRAIFCANDIMALTIMDRFQKAGIRIPEDVILTGFDGLEHSAFSHPSLSTCCEDTDALAALTMSTVIRLNGGEDVPSVQKYPYKAVIGDSSSPDGQHVTQSICTKIFYRMRTDEINEQECSKWLNKVISVPGMKNLRKCLAERISSRDMLGIRADAFFSEEAFGRAPTEYLEMKKNNGRVTESLKNGSEMILSFTEKLTPEYMGFFSMISQGSFIYGTALSLTDDIQREAGKINRHIQNLNCALYIGLCGERQHREISERYAAKYVDALTGLRNIDGANKWFVDITKDSNSHNIQLTVGVYTFINYQQVMENDGMAAVEDYMQYMAKSLTMANRDDAIVARISIDSFCVLIMHKPDSAEFNIVDKSVELFYGFLDIKCRSNPDITPIEVSCGYTDAIPPWHGKLNDYINAATSNLYLNRVNFRKNMPSGVDSSDKTKMNEHHAMFMALINENLFNYHFQPIVDAHTGEVCAYEALMRTTGNIKMNPLEVLETALLYSKLPAVEFATFRNVFEKFSSHREEFGARKVFINTIPGHFLNKHLCTMICNEFPGLLDNIVVEITESETISVDELDSIRTFCGLADKNIRIAVDDYGTGHSNIVNLLEYHPQIVKIDRYLITNIQSDRNKQMFVKNLIEFADENNIKVLAEGVETEEEMRTVIGFGVDLIQGYYTGRPSEKIVTEIAPEIKEQIIRYSSTQEA